MQFMYRNMLDIAWLLREPNPEAKERSWPFFRKKEQKIVN